MTASVQSTLQKEEPLLRVYPQLSTLSDLSQALVGVSTVAVYGISSRRERSHLQELLRTEGDKDGCHLIFITSPSLSVPRETLLYPAHLSEHQLVHLLRELYDTDAVICGVLSPALLDE